MVPASMVVEVLGFSRLISPNCAATSTDCEIAAGESVKFTVEVWPTEILVAQTAQGRNLGVNFKPVCSWVDLAEEKASILRCSGLLGLRRCLPLLP